MPNMYDTLKDRVRAIADAQGLQLGWRGEPFVVPQAPHLRGEIVIQKSEAASLGRYGLTRDEGFVEIGVVVPIGQDSQAMELAGRVAAAFRKGEKIYYDSGTVTIFTPSKGAPTSDGKHTTAVATIKFMAHYRA